jgi:D-sedoheptulose 7-phosphate isomerase
MRDATPPDVDGAVGRYLATLGRLLRGALATDHSQQPMTLEAACEWIAGAARQAHESGNTVLFVGNGGSAAIASHLAIDFSKSGNLRAMAFNDAAALTCLGNDLGYENVFARQIEFHGRAGDLLVAISSSGSSPSILNAVAAARARGLRVATYSGFGERNPLRGLGDVNVFVDSRRYGLLEVAHLALCHAVLDIATGRVEEPGNA